MKLILVGFMASGKTSVSQFLGRKLDVPVLDLDREIERQSRKTIPEIFAAGGEESFRLIEHQVLAGLQDFPGILATGGGTPLREDNRQLLKDSGAPIVLLQASPQVTFSRLHKQSGRPLADTLSEEGIAELQQKRQASYDQCTDLVINTDELTVSEIADRVVGLLG